jgi:hypothetical protein
MMKWGVCVLGVMLLAGCAMGWTRPDTTASEFYQDKMQCEQQAVQMYPPSYAHNTYQSPAMTSCQTYGNHVECMTNPGTVSTTPGYDANAVNRNMAIGECLRGKGYVYKIGQ